MFTSLPVSRALIEIKGLAQVAADKVALVWDGQDLYQALFFTEKPRGGKVSPLCSTRWLDIRRSKLK
jgi:hypothetical protein